MAILQGDDIADLVSITLKDLGRGKFTEIASSLQEYIALPNLLRKERIAFGSGTGVTFNVMTKTSGAAKNTGLFAVDQVNVGDVMATGTVPWRHTKTDFAIERREVSMNRNPARVVEILKVRRIDAMIDLAKKMETNFWNDPPDDNETPFGVPYWIVRNATSGLNGGNPTNFSGGAAGLTNASTSGGAQWANHTERYTSITKTDLIRKWRKAATLTNFMSPVAVPEYNMGNRYGYYTGYNIIGEVEELLEAQNDRLGNDIASMDGRLIFRKTPVTHVPHFNSEVPNSSRDTLYGINWGVFKIAVLRGEYLRETGPMVAANQHNTLQMHIDLSYNFVCYDRKRLFVIDKT